MIVFVGSSSRASDDALKVATWIENAGHKAKVWTDPAVFVPGESTLEGLLAQVGEVDAAALVFAPDDLVVTGGMLAGAPQPRDNVVLECGLFLGALGAKRVVFCRRGDAKIPADLAGITYVNLEKEAEAQRKVGVWLRKLEKIHGKREGDAGFRIASTHPVIEVISEKQEDNKRGTPTLFTISDDGMKFFGYAPAAVEASDLIEKPAVDLMMALQQWIDPPTMFWEDLLKDQEFVYKEHAEGREAIARVPIIFNPDHPYFPEKVFVPLMASWKNIERNGREHEVSRVVYVDIAKLPKYVFVVQIWEEVKRDLEPERLASDFARIREAWIAEPAGTDAEVRLKRARVEALAKAEEEIRRGGGTRALELCARVGLFALREAAEKHRLETARTFIERLLDPRRFRSSSVAR